MEQTLDGTVKDDAPLGYLLVGAMRGEIVCPFLLHRNSPLLPFASPSHYLSAQCIVLLVTPTHPVSIQAAIFSLKRGAITGYIRKQAFLQISKAVNDNGGASKKVASATWQHYSSK